MERDELFSEFSFALQGEDTGAFGGRLSRPKGSRTVAKSRLIEVHPAMPGHDGVLELLADIAAGAEMQVVEADESLAALLSPKDAFVVDAIEDRFWFVHTTASAGALDHLMRRHVLRRPRFDSAWMPEAVLRALPGEPQFVSSTFTTDQFGPRRARRSRVRYEGDDSKAFFDYIRKNKDYRASVPLNQVGTTIDERGVGQASVTVDFRGRFAASGDSFEAAQSGMWKILDQYRSYIEDLENRFRLRFTAEPQSAGFSVSGEVAMIDLPDGVDVHALLAGLFSCREPFRLWAVPREVAPGFWEAAAADLHVGQTLRLEISQQQVRALLPEGTCGNTLARLLVNLQHQRAHERIPSCPAPPMPCPFSPSTGTLCVSPAPTPRRTDTNTDSTVAPTVTHPLRGTTWTPPGPL